MPTFYNGNASNVTTPVATIIGATNATPIVIQTSGPHLMSDGDRVEIFGVRGNTAANSPFTPYSPWTITFIDSTHFSLNGSAGNGAYVDGGIAADVSLNPPVQLISDGSDDVNASMLNPPEESAADREQYLWTALLGLEIASRLSPMLNWGPSQWLAADSSNPPTGVVALGTTNLRGDGTAQCFYSPTLMQWVVTGVNTNGEIHVGDEGWLNMTTTGASRKYTHGCEAGGKILVFPSADVTTNPLVYERTPDLSAWTTFTISSAAFTHARANANVVLANGHIMLAGGTFGGGLDALRTWTSSDGGASWVSHLVVTPPSGSFQALSGITVGAAARVFVWQYDTAGANGGDLLWYSDNEGSSWTQTSAIAHGNIRDIVYVATFGAYLVLTDAGYAITTDLTDPTKYDWNTSVVIKAAATDGVNIVFLDATPPARMRVSLDMLTSAATIATPLRGTPYHIAFGQTSRFKQFAMLSVAEFRASTKVVQ